MSSVNGKAFVLGDDVDTDALAPGRFMKAPINVLAAHCLCDIDPDFASAVRPGDVLVAGRNFGMGSSREQAAEALKYLGLAGVVARSFSGLFYRNAVNLGLPVFTATDLDLGRIKPGDSVELDWAAARLRHAGADIALDPLPDFLLQLIEDSGLVPHLEKRFRGDGLTNDKEGRRD
jgi:3-isopropylmalate/(R)-2-methylmalate dehydratase small subunit